MTREEVIKGLECCLTASMGEPICPTCTYRYDENGIETGDCEINLLKDAIALLKALEPRVMTLEEITDLKYHDMVYVEFKHPRKEEYRTLGGFVDQMYKDINTTEIKAIDITVGVNEIAHCRMKLYLNDFRLWTSRPTDAQREATPWP